MSQESNLSTLSMITQAEPPKRKTDLWRKCFATFNNFQKYPGAIAHLKRYLENPAELKKTPISGIAMQPERAPTTGTPHLQMYIEFKPGSRLSSKQIHEIPGLQHVAIKQAPRSVNRCLDYVTKQATRLSGYPDLRGSGGEFRGQSKAKSRRVIFDQILQGKMTPKQIFQADPDLYIRQSSGLHKAISLCQKDRIFKTKGIIYYGPTGCGKTIKAWLENPKAYPFSWPKGSRMWLDKYSGGNPEGTGHDTMIWDEFRSNRLSKNRLLDIIGNSKPYPCQTKGGWTTFSSHKVIITTNEEPMNWYPNLSAEKFSTVRRRILQSCKIYDFTVPDLPHWAIDYQGPDLPLEQLLSEIICTERTSEVPRTVGPEHRVDRGHDYNFANRYTTPNIASQVQRQYSRRHLTGKKRKREVDNQGPPRKIRRPDNITGPYASYGQTPVNKH